jgi:hypothetical protein
MPRNTDAIDTHQAISLLAWLLLQYAESWRGNMTFGFPGTRGKETSTMTRTLLESTFATVLLFAFAACSNEPQPSVNADAGIDVSSAKDSGAADSTTRVTVNVDSPRAISPMLYGHNYYNWIAAWGGQVLGVKDMVVPLGLNLLRAGGTPSDVSTPVMFDFDQLDTFVHYAADVGAQPLLQIPFVGLRDANGNLIPATSQNAAAIVQHANVDRGYGIRYFTIGNEPDIYEEQGQKIGGQSTVGYTPEQFCAKFSEYVAAMKAADPTIRIVGPELSWKYSSGNDWLSPFLRGCGDLVDVVTIHLYPFSSTQDTAEAVLSNAPSFRATIRNVRQLMVNSGYGGKPFGITESHVTWDDDPAKPQLSGAPGSIAAGLWIADVLGVAMEEDLWTLAFWSLSEAWTISFIDGRTPKPEYYALMTVRQHFRSAIGSVTGAPEGVSAYAGRNDNSTPVLFVNKTSKQQNFTVAIVGAPTAITDVSIAIPPLSLVVLEIPDSGAALAWVYGDTQRSQGIGPQAFTPGDPLPMPVADAAAPDATAETNTGIACDVEMPTAEGRFSIADNFVTIGSLHGFASAWTWVGSDSNATACATPTCSAPGSLKIGTVPDEGAAPLTTEPVTCVPGFAPSALCIAGAITKDPTYQSVAALGFNLQEAPPVEAGTDAGPSEASLDAITIPTSIAITVQKFGSGSGNNALRLQLTDSNDHYFCALEGTWSSAQPIPITHFNSKCWDNSGTYATPTMSFKRVDVLVPSSAPVDRSFAFCLTEISLQ